MKTFLSPVVGAAMASFMLSAHADFIDDSHADVTLLNRYLNQQGRDVVGSSAKAHSIRDWGQGFEFNFKSGYTEGTVGFGLDLQAFYGLKLDSGGDLNDKNHQGRYPGSMFPLDNGKSADQFGVLSPTLKMRFAKDELRLGTLYGNNPLLANTDGRLYQQTNTGVQLVSKDLSDFTFTGGDIFKTKIRNETGDQGMITAGGTKRAIASSSAARTTPAYRTPRSACGTPTSRITTSSSSSAPSTTTHCRSVQSTPMCAYSAAWAWAATPMATRTMRQPAPTATA
jgi:hypothetical protein